MLGLMNIGAPSNSAGGERPIKTTEANRAVPDARRAGRLRGPTLILPKNECWLSALAPLAARSPSTSAKRARRGARCPRPGKRHPARAVRSADPRLGPHRPIVSRPNSRQNQPRFAIGSIERLGLKRFGPSAAPFEQVKRKGDQSCAATVGGFVYLSLRKIDARLLGVAA